MLDVHYLSMPESSIEVHPRPVSYYNGDSRNHRKSLTSAELNVDSKIHRDDNPQTNWRDAFNGKWPYLTPLFHKSEEDTITKLQEQTKQLENNFHRSTTSINSSQWEGSIHDIWTGSNRTVNEAFEVSSSLDTEVKKPKRCEKTCRRLLCVFLGVSIIGALLTGIGLSVFLTSHNRGSHSLYTQDLYIDPNLSLQEQQYLTNTFCNLVKTMLKGTDFPVETGIASCQAELRLTEGSESLHIEMDITPKKGFTIKEKFRRALKEEILAEGAYRINGTNKCLYVNGFHKTILCDERQNNSHSVNISLFNTTNKTISPSKTQEATQSVQEIQHKDIKTDRTQTNTKSLQMDTSRISITTESVKKVIRPSTSTALWLESSYSGTAQSAIPPTELISLSTNLEKEGYHSDRVFSTTVLYESSDYHSTDESTVPDVNKSSPVRTRDMSFKIIPAVKESSDWFDWPSSTITAKLTRTSGDSKSFDKEFFSTTTPVPDNITDVPTIETQTNNTFIKRHSEFLSDRETALPKESTDTYVAEVIQPAIDSFPTPLPSIASELKAQDEADLIWRLNLYGASKSKNYLRFPIVTGSNGKFLFSPLSNKDSIDLVKQPQTVGDKNKVNSGVSKITSDTENDIPNLTNAPERIIADINKTPMRSSNYKPKAIKVDWKTPPLAKPTKYPSDGTVGLKKSNDLQKSSPDQPKVIFNISEFDKNIV